VRLETPSCDRCLADRLRSRITRSIRPPAPGRLQRLVRRAGVAVAVGALASVPLTTLVGAPSAEARSVIAMPQIQLPVKQPGYQLATARGDVLPFGSAAGAPAPATAPAKVTGVARTPGGGGSWTVASDGGVFTSGDAPFKGSLGGVRLNKPIVGIAATPSGQGYWLVSSDGGVFAFGDAKFHGAAVGKPLNKPIADLAPTPTGKGYWLVSGDGGVFAFGDAKFHGAAAGQRLNAPITSMASTRTGEGYWLVSGDGGVFAFGNARFYGAAAGRPLNGKVVGIAPSRTDRGYWLASSDGGVFTFGDAPFLGSGGGGAWGTVVGITGGVGLPVAEPVRQQSAQRTLQNRYGHDISWPQCDGPYPVAGYGHAVIGVTGGRPFTQNRCLESQWRWATVPGSGAAVYVNVASPRWGEPAAMQGPAGACAGHDLPCQAYNHSANNMEYALTYARQSGVDSPMWWIDVEVLNRWSADRSLNALTVKAAMETLQKHGRRVGVYSTYLQWRRITGDASFGLPIWIAGAPTDADAPSYCHRTDKHFNGGEPWLVQSIPIQYDVNWACDAVADDPTKAFVFRDGR
jgi:hypothetical protein